MTDAQTPTIETYRFWKPLAQIRPNPYQTRLGEDAAHIQALADDIQVNGLLQVPLARPHPTEPAEVELAFGHSRLAAYRLLADQGFVVFLEMPLDVRPLTDRQMSDLAAAENAKRKNLSAIETAMALQMRIKTFGLGQAEAGQPFGLSQSAVANLLRLLKLPKSVQDQVHAGELPERLARQMATLAVAAPKQIEAVAKAVAKAPPAERDEALVQELERVMDDHGRDMRQAAFEPDWPLIPIAVEAPKDGEPTMLVACLGCPYHYKRDFESWCVNPPCWELKQAEALKEALAAAHAKTGLPAANGEKTSPVMRRYDYMAERQLPALAKAGRTDDSLGLRVAVGDDDWGVHEEVTGHNRIHVVTIAPTAVKRWMETAEKENGKGRGTGKAVKVEPAKAAANGGKGLPASKADLEKQKAAEAAAREAERQAQEERRRERGEALRVEADVVWLIKNFTEIAAPQLTISGHILAYAADRWIGRGMGRGRAANFEGLLQWHDDLQSRAESTNSTKELEELLRQRIVACEIFEHCLGSFGDKPTFGHIVDDLADLAAPGFDGNNDQPGLGAKLPAGWNKPPIHRTEGNCWHCGRFGSQRGRLTKAELEAGWTVALQDVRCPDCKDKAPAAPKVTHKAAAVAAKKAKGKK